MNPDDTVTIPRTEYEALRDESRFLACLDAAGVDNWQGYDMARELYQEKSE